MQKPSRETVFSALVESGKSGSDPRVAPALYASWRDQVDPNDRMSLVADLNMHLDRVQSGPAGLMIVLGSENNINIGATAALGLALLMPNEGKSLFNGPELVIKLGMSSPHMETKIAALGGILLLGDRRVMPLLRQPYRNLNSVERRELAFIDGHFVWAGVVEFWINCLEDEPEEKWGRALWALYDLPTRAPVVRDVERQFPAYRRLPDGKSQRIVKEWTITEFGKVIEPRLRRLGQLETQDPIMPKVLKAWGIESK